MNPYETLGVSKSASKDEIKKAFRTKAKKHHPDKGGDAEAFKKINEAYETLSDDRKKAQYDQFGSMGGSAGGGAGGFGGFQGGNVDFDFGGMGGAGGFEDVFSSFFGGVNNRTQQRNTPQRGSDLEVDVTLDFDEAVKGISKTFPARRYESCHKCDTKGGEGQKTCSTCSGSGTMAQKFQTPFGVVQQQTTCGTCHGTGKTFETLCTGCKGDGRVENKSNIEVKIPAGLEDNTTLRMRGKGDAGKNGAGSGDLYIHIRVTPSKTFRRSGLNLESDLEVSIFDAILGTEVEVKTFWGKETITVPEKTEDGSIIKIVNQGIKRDGQSGDHLVKIKHVMPSKLSSKMRDLLEKVKKETKSWF